MSKKGRKFMSMLIGFGLISILLYSLVYVITATTPSVAIPPKTATPTPTPTTPPGTPTPTPTPTIPPPTGRLEIQTIPQDDQLREMGIMIAGVRGPSFDEHAEYKVDFRQDGVHVNPDKFACFVFQKTVCNPTKPRQFLTEEEATKVNDRTGFDPDDFDDSSCFCRFRQAPGVPGVGVLDLYCPGIDIGDDDRWGDYIVKVVACRGAGCVIGAGGTCSGGTCGAEIQDLCILGDSSCEFFDHRGNDSCVGFKDPGFRTEGEFNGSTLFADPIFPFASCKYAAIFQRGEDEENGGFDLPQCFF